MRRTPSLPSPSPFFFSFCHRHPEVKEKNRLRIAERRLAKKQYRRQWDPLKTKAPGTANSVGWFCLFCSHFLQLAHGLHSLVDIDTPQPVGAKLAEECASQTARASDNFNGADIGEALTADETAAQAALNTMYHLSLMYVWHVSRKSTSHSSNTGPSIKSPKLWQRSTLCPNRRWRTQ